MAGQIVKLFETFGGRGRGKKLIKSEIRGLEFSPI
jgi:hypothetical protein